MYYDIERSSVSTTQDPMYGYGSVIKEVLTKKYLYLIVRHKILTISLHSELNSGSTPTSYLLFNIIQNEICK